MKILAIESSCDETAASIVEDGTKIISNVVATSVEMHAKTGGIIPEVAAREQIKCIVPVIEEALEKLKIKNQKSKLHIKNQIDIKDIDAVAVTIGPGLIGSLLVGIETAKTLAYLWKKPIVPVNHLIGHIYANWIDFQIPEFPAIALVVSGGHTDLVLMKDHGDITWIGGTRDDAAGECFDKSARLLGLGYPGGPAISAAAAKYQILNTKYKIHLPRPIMDEDNFDFSFSGLKTAVLREVSKVSDVSKVSNAIAYELQEAITDVLVTKTIKAAEKFHVQSILLAGGVSANSRLREKFQILNTKYQIHVPPVKLCTDNAAFIASAAFFNYHPIPWQNIKVNPGLKITDRI
jgi:N6-L-threonylcarbamoyladenine synthase